MCWILDQVPMMRISLQRISGEEETFEVPQDAAWSYWNWLDQFHFELKLDQNPPMIFDQILSLRRNHGECPLPVSKSFMIYDTVYPFMLRLLSALVALVFTACLYWACRGRNGAGPAGCDWEIGHHWRRTVLWWKGNFATLPVVLLYFDFFRSQFCESGLFWNFTLVLVPSCRLQLHPHG